MNAFVLLFALLCSSTSSVMASSLEDKTEKFQAGSYSLVETLISSTSKEVKVSGVIAAIIIIAIGAFFCLFGYKMLKVVLFLASFVLGGAIAAHFASTAHASGLTCFIVFIIVGLICGCLVTFCFYPAGVFAIGAIGGGYSGVLLMGFVRSVSKCDSAVLFYILVIVLGLIGGILAWKLERPVLIIATAFFGSYAVLFSLAYLIKSGSWWIYAILTVVVAAFGAWFQDRTSPREPKGLPTYFRFGRRS